MKTKRWTSREIVVLLTMAVCLPGVSSAGEAKQKPCAERDQAVEYARIMSHVKWTPVAGTLPNRKGGYFQEGTEYTGVPYSSVKAVGRCIGFDIYLKTFLAAVENPQSVLYTENLSGQVSNAGPYYGKVCSTFTSYGWQCALPYRSSQQGPEFRQGVVLVEPQSAQAAEPGDIIYTPPAKPGGGSHVELVTGVERSGGSVTAVRVEDSWPPTTRDQLYDAEKFDSHLASRNRRLFRITDLAAWREQNQAELFRFPNYREDSATPVINRVLLLDRGDWVPYFSDQPVKFNVMDRDSRGVQALVIQRGNTEVERIALRGRALIERLFSVCGDYTAHCVMKDGSSSPACEFSVCELGFTLPDEPLKRTQPWEIQFTARHLDPMVVQIMIRDRRYNVWLTEQDRRNGKVTVPAGLVEEAGPATVWLTGETRYGRLTREQKVPLVD